MGPYRALESSPPFVIVCRSMRPALLALMCIALLGGAFAFTLSTAHINRGLDLRCTRGGDDACVLTTDYGLWKTTRTMPLATLDAGGAAGVRSMRDKNGIFYAATLTDATGTSVDVARRTRDLDEADAVRGELSHFLTTPDQRTYTRHVDVRSGFAVFVIFPMVLFGVLIVMMLRRSEIIFDDGRRTITIVRYRWPLTPEIALVDLDAVRCAEVTVEGWGRNRNVSLVLQRTDGNTVPVFTKGGDPGYQRDIAAQINARLGS